MGTIHLASSVVALVLGTWVIASTKGTPLHRKIGYAYAVSMVVLNVTAFSIYRLFDGFGPFHIAAIISSVTLICGIVPAVFRKPSNGWRPLHVAFMYYSVIGLYAAFASEIVTRIPGLPFGTMVFIATGIVMFAGVYFFKKNSPKWMKA